MLATLLLWSLTIFWRATKHWKVGEDKRCYRSRSLKAAAPIISAHTRHLLHVTGIRYKSKVKTLRSPFDRRADMTVLYITTLCCLSWISFMLAEVLATWPLSANRCVGRVQISIINNPLVQIHQVRGYKNWWLACERVLDKCLQYGDV